MTSLLWPRTWRVERNLYVWLDHRIKPFAGDPRGLAPCGESWLRWILGWRFSFEHMRNGLWRLRLGPLVASWPHHVTLSPEEMAQPSGPLNDILDGDSGFWVVESVTAGQLGVRRATDEEIAAALREGRDEASRPGRDSRAR